jgi:exportin-T
MTSYISDIKALNEISNLLQTIAKVRGDEALSYISTVFLPSQNLPPSTSLDIANNMRDLDKRSFQKYLAEFIKASRAS